MPCCEVFYKAFNDIEDGPAETRILVPSGMSISTSPSLAWTLGLLRPYVVILPDQDALISIGELLSQGLPRLEKVK